MIAGAINRTVPFWFPGGSAGRTRADLSAWFTPDNRASLVIHNVTVRSTYLPLDSILPCWKYAAKRAYTGHTAESLQFPHQRNCCTDANQRQQYRQVFLGRRGGECLSIACAPESSSTKLSKPMEEQSTGQSLTTKSNGRQPSPKLEHVGSINTKLANGFGIGGSAAKCFATCFSSPAAFRNQSARYGRWSWFPEW